VESSSAVVSHTLVDDFAAHGFSTIACVTINTNLSSGAAEKIHECKSVSPNTLTECLDRVETIVHDDAEMEADGVDLTDVDTEHLIHELLKRKKDFEFINAVTRLIQPQCNKCPRTTRTC